MSQRGKAKNSPRASSSPTSTKKETKSVEYEFGGPVGAFMTVVSLPCVIYALYFLCGPHGDCMSLYPFYIPDLPDWSTVEWWNTEAFLITCGWFVWLAVLSFVVPGPVVPGVQLANGQRLLYKMNGFRSFVLSLGALGVLEGLGVIRLAFIFDHLVGFITSSIVISLTLSVYLYATSFMGQKLLAAGGNTGNPVYDFFIGRELNPRIGSFDLKVFCELRPGLIGWVVIDWAMAAAQYEQSGAVSNAMWLVCLFQTWYVADALWFEQAILTTMDVTTDGFGYMLAFGDLAWVPYTYSIQARYLASVPFFQWNFAMIAFFVGLKLLGYSAFRGANSQKDQFRRDPNHPSVKNIKTIQTQRGTRLMISGWWGIARHINYVGDWTMAWSWCLPCGISHIVPFFYVIYFGILLAHRDLRDEHSCRLKYGKDWDRYCSIVRYRFIPYIY